MALRNLLGAAVVLAMLFAPLGSQRVSAQTTLTKLNIGASPSDLGAEVFYAKDLGYFQKAGLDVEISPIPSGPTIMAAVASKGLDIGWGNAIDVAAAHQRGIPITIVATATVEDKNNPGTGLLAVAQTSAIRTAKDLTGKTIALLSLGNLTEISTKAWLDQNGGDSKGVHFVELPYSQMPDAVKAGRVDAAVLDNTADPTIGKPGAALLVLSAVFFAVAPRLEGAVWYATSDWVNANPTIARQFVAVMNQTAEWANGHHHESAQILAAHIARTAAQIDSNRRVLYGTNVSPALIQPELDLAFKYGLLKQPMPAREIISSVATP